MNIAWQGGEPTLMGLDFFKRSIELVEKYKKPGQQIAAHHPDQRHENRRRMGGFLQTAQFPGRVERGRPAATARYLPGQQGRLRQLRPGDARLAFPAEARSVDVNILCTVHAANADHPLEVYHFFRDELKAQYMQFIPIVERATEETLPLANQGWSERPAATARCTPRLASWSPSAR